MKRVQDPLSRGSLVRFAAPSTEEADQVFVVLEMRGDRVLVGVTDPHHYGIAPTFVYLVADLELSPCAC